MKKYDNCDNCRHHNPMTDYCEKAKQIIPCGSHVCSGFMREPQKEEKKRR